jgi:hypothetical protein
MKAKLPYYLLFLTLFLNISFVFAQAIGAPTNLTAYVISKSDITLFWTDNSSNESGFVLEVSTDNVTWTVTRNPGANATGQSASGLTAGTLYYFRICAVVGGVNTAYSNVVSATTFANSGTAPAAPSGLTATASGSNVINLSWVDNSSNEINFEIQRSTDGTNYTLISTAGPNATTYSNTVAAGSTYYYRVRATNIYGSSSYTTAASVNMPAGSNLEDITNATNANISALYSGSGTETVSQFIDNNVTTKYLVNNPNNWIKLECPRTYVATKYTITSANDWMERDPSGWTFEGSMDGTTWTTLDVQSNITFASRTQTREFSFTNTAEHLYYRLTIPSTKGSPDMQMMEWQIWGVPGTVAPPSGAPTNFTATVASSNQINLNWTDNSNNESGFSIFRSEDGITYTLVTTVAANTTTYSDLNLSASTPFAYKVRAQNAGGFSAYAGPVFATTQTPVLPPDITDNAGGIITDQYGDVGGDNNLIDNSVNTRYYANYATTWIGFQAAASAVVTAYAIASSNDNSSHDLKNWTFEGSNNGTTWTILNTQSGVIFPNRQGTKTYTFSNTNAYTYYRLNVTSNNGASSGTAFAEWQIFGTGGGSPKTTAPTAPNSLVAKAVSGDQILVTWNDGSNETSYRIEWSTDGGTTWDYKNLVANSTKFIHHDLIDLTIYTYRLRAENPNGISAYIGPAKDTTLSDAFVDTWQEHWLEHNQLVTKVYSNESVAIYFDPDVKPQVNWMDQIVTTAWEYTKKTYGSFSSPKFHAIFHQDKYGGGNPSSYFDATRDYRNAICVGKNGDWTSSTDWDLDATIHEIGHIVEGGSKGVHNSPAFPLWGDSKWMEIYQYDLYTKVGWTAEATRWYNNCIGNTDSYPRAGTHWFKDWWIPIYTQYGGTDALNRFFTLLAIYFPQFNGEYSRNMNYGEFVHFWSGAACADLKAQATIAFGWPDSWEIQYRQAQIDFPFTYVCPNLAINNITKTYGDASFTIAATSNSTGKITYTITSGSKYATITSDGQVTIKGAGTVTIQAVQEAAAGFNIGTAQITLTINKASLKITADDKSKVYGSANPALTMSYSGFVYGETSAVLTSKPSISTAATATSNVGSYPIILSGGSADNYTISLVNATLTVTQATPTLTYTGASSGTQGETISLSATSNSTGLISYNVSNGTGAANVTGTTLNLTQAGTVSLTVTVAATTNYATYSIQVIITINALQNPNITFNNITKTYGDPDFSVTATSNSPGVITYSITSGAQYATITSGGLVSIKGAGMVVIQASQDASSGYSSGTQTANLTIGKSYAAGLTYTGPTSGKVGDILTMTAISSSTGTISYQVLSGGTGNATVSTDKLTLNSAGTVTIQIMVTEDPNYYSQIVTEEITINSITTGVTNGQASNSLFSVYPNPSNEVVNVQLNMNERCRGTIELCDINGKLLFIIASGQMEKQSLYTVPVNGLSAGTYIIKLNGDNGIAQQYVLFKTNH